MESRIMGLVKAMHEKFGLANAVGPISLQKEEKEFRIAAMQEELNEYAEAETSVDQYDALLDLIVFAVGTLERHGFPLLEGFEEVIKCNMAKELGQNGKKRGGFKRDLVKPAGWTGPEEKLMDILVKASVAAAPKPRMSPFCVAQSPKEIAPSVAQSPKEIAPSSDGTIQPGFAPKFDATKVRVDLLPVGPMLQIAEVFTFGAKKYFADSYRQGETVAWSRTYGSIMRHMMSFWNGEDKDPESHLSHLAHAGTQLCILMEHSTYNKDKDDRFVRGQS